jgi:hypothetical protein
MSVGATGPACLNRCLMPFSTALGGSSICSAPRPSQEPGSLDEFLVQCLSRMQVDILKNTLGLGGGDHALEPTWQHEFFRAATASLHAGPYITPAVGHIFGASGMVDFYISETDKEWLVEITREGDRLAEHANRFEQGQCACIPWMARVILDFRCTRPQPYLVERYTSLVWYVVFNDGTFETATIVRHGKEDQVIIFARAEKVMTLAELTRRITELESAQRNEELEDEELENEELENEELENEELENEELENEELENEELENALRNEE